MVRRSRNKRIVGFLILLLVLGVSIGYATLYASLDVTGYTSITSQTWDVHFANVANAAGSSNDVVVTQAARINPSDNHLVEFNVDLKKPGDSYSFNVNVVNGGSLPAKARLSITGLTGTAASYLDWSVSGINTTTGEVISPSGSKTITVTIRFKESITELPANNTITNVALAARVDSEQA